MAKQNVIGADLSREQADWVIHFQRDSGLSRSEIVRMALNCFRGAAISDLILLEKKLEGQIQFLRSKLT
jgi:hypothetical protein